MRMRHMWISVVLQLCLFGPAIAADPPPPASDVGIPEVVGNPGHGLKPSFNITREPFDWGFEIELTAQREFEPFSWLKVPGRFGSRLQLWRDDQTEIRPKTNVVAVMNPPATDTVSNLLHSAIHPRWRGDQWWPGGSMKAPVTDSCHLSGFNLRSVFDLPFTNDVVLQITPLIYRANTNQTTANLVELPPTKIKLSANGTVRKME
jgi:hypothetical protein